MRSSFKSIIKNSLLRKKRKHYKELTPKKKEKAFKRIAKETKAKYGVDVNVGDHLPLDGVKYAYCLNLSTCNGSRKCVTACPYEARHFNFKEPTIDRAKINTEQSYLNTTRIRNQLRIITSLLFLSQYFGPYLSIL